jgi:hypothetical protein
VYLHPGGTAQAKFSGKNLDKAVGIPGTGRNWNAVLKVNAISKR